MDDRSGDADPPVGGEQEEFPEFPGGDGDGMEWEAGEEGEDDAVMHLPGPQMTIQDLFRLLHENNPVEARMLLQQLVLGRRQTFNTHQEMFGELFGGEPDPLILHALRCIERAWFVPSEDSAAAYRDAPVELPELGTNLSAPHIYPSMLRELRLTRDRPLRVLDVGSGTGYMSALLAHILGPAGYVEGWELSPAAVAFARKCWRDHPELQCLAPTTFHARDCFDCIADHELGSFDAIVIGASLSRTALPHILQLLRRPRGVLVAPIDDALTAIQWCEETCDWLHLQAMPVRFRDMILPPLRVWSPETHMQTPEHFRKAIFTTLCIWRLRDSGLETLPREVLFQIFAHSYKQGCTSTSENNTSDSMDEGEDP